MSRWPKTLAVVAALAGALCALPARGEDLPPRHQALLLLRVLAYDRNLKQRVGASATVLVLYRPGDLASEARRSALRHAFEEVAREVVVSGLPVAVEEVPYRSVAELDARLESNRAAMVYVDHALEGDVSDITSVTRRRGVLSADGSRSMVEAGVAIGIVARSGRAAVTVNLPAARQEGANLDSALLAVAEVLRDEGEGPGKPKDAER
jgi:hypothetical protein